MDSEHFCPELLTRPKSRVSATKEDYEHIKSKEIAAAKNYDILNKDFRSLDCSVCDVPFGYQYRADPNVYICNPRCLTVARRKLLPNEENDPFLTPMSSSPVSGSPNPPELLRITPNHCVDITLDQYAKAVGTSSNAPNAVFQNEICMAQIKPLQEMIKLTSKQQETQEIGSTFSNFPAAPWLSKPRASPTPTPENLADNFEKLATDVAQTNKIWTLNDLQLSKSFFDGAKVGILFTWDPITYTLQAVADEDSIASMQDAIYEYCEKTQPMTRTPAVGEIIFATFPKDEAFYRARVTIGMDQEQEITVDYIDFGSRSKLSLNECWEPSQKIMKANPLYGLIYNLNPPALAQIPSLHDCDPEYRRVIIDEFFVIKVLRAGHAPWRGSLIMQDGRDLLNMIKFCGNLNTILEEEMEDELTPVDKLLDEVYKIQRQFQKPESIQVTKSNSERATDSSSIRSDPNPARQETRSISELKSSSSDLSPKTEDETTLNRRKRSRTIHGMALSASFYDSASVSISYFWSLGKVTLTAVADDKALDELQESIQKYVITAPVMKRSPAIDEIVLAPYADAYYRARVLSAADRNMMVAFIDFGDQDIVEIQKCRQINDELLTLPVYGLVLKIENIPQDVPITSTQEEKFFDTWELEVFKKGNFSSWHGQLWNKKNKDKNYADIALEAGYL